MEDNRIRPHGRVVAVLLAACLLLPLLYVLSIGPVAMIYYHFADPKTEELPYGWRFVGDAVEQLYSPLGWALDQEFSEGFVEDSFDWYVRLWADMP